MYETFFRHAFLPFFETAVKRRPTYRLLAEYEGSQWLEPQALAQRQLDKLNALLAQAWREVPFLAGWWRDHGVQPGPLRTVAELAAYPVMSRDFIRDNHQALTAGASGLRVLSKSTGGSTGSPLRITYTQDSYAARTALMWRGYRWAGTDIGRRTAYLWGQPAAGSAGRRRKEALYHTLFNRRIFNSLPMRSDNLGEYVQALNRFRPRTIVGYTTPLATLARWIIDQGATVHRPENLLTGAEALHEPQRQVIQQAFGARVFNTYGCREVGLIASECEAGALHVSADHLVVETVDDADRPVSGRPGHVLVTDLSNHALPFVRYRVGDLATLSPGGCGCGRGLPLFASLQGRTLDLIRTRDGRLVPGEFFPTVFNELPGVLHYQVVQPDLDHLQIRLVTRQGAPQPDSVRLLAELRQTLGNTVQISLEWVDRLELTAAGKLRVTISHVRP
jgi:phenylacetate-CoA ligase